MRRRASRLAPALAVSALLLLAPPRAVAAEPKSYALLIGVGSYQQWPNLVNPLPDVRALTAELSGRYGFLAETLEDPTREEIVAHLRRYVDRTYGPDDQLVIVFAGHGNYDEVTRIGYLAAQDSASRRRDPNFATLLSYPLLLTLIDHVPIRRILVVVDACYSGSLAGDGAAASASAAGDAPSRRFLTSGGTEYVPDGDPDRHTPFVRALLAGLRSTGEGGRLDFETLVGERMGEVEPRPRSGRFGSDGGGGAVAFTVQRGRGAATTVSTSGTGAVPPPAAAPPAADEPPLRRRAQSLGRSQLERSFKRLGLYDATWNREGDYANQYRVQERGVWNVMLDLESGLTWQQGGSEMRMTFEQAQAYVESLRRERHAGHDDWRLPTLEELGSLLEAERQGESLFIYPLFDGEQETCWSADRDADSGQPYYVSFNAGRSVLAYGSKMAFVRAVRAP